MLLSNSPPDKIFSIFHQSQAYQFNMNEKHERRVNMHCVKSVRIRSYSGPHFFRIFFIWTEYGVSLRNQSECEKMRKKCGQNNCEYRHFLLSDERRFKMSLLNIDSMKILFLSFPSQERSVSQTYPITVTSIHLKDLL